MKVSVDNKQSGTPSSHLNEQIIELQNDQTIKTKTIEQLQVQFNDKDHLCQKKEEEIQALQSQLEESQNNLKVLEAHQEEIHLLKQQKDGYNAQLKKLQEDLSSAGSNKEQIENEKTKVEINLKENEAKYGQLENTLKNQNQNHTGQFQSLQKEKDEYEAKLQKLQHDLKQADLTKNNIESEKQKIEENLQFNQRKYENLESEFQNQLKKYQKQAQQLSSTNSQLSQKEGELSSIQALSQSLKETIQQLNINLQNEKIQLENITREKAIIEKKLSLIEAENQQLKDTLQKKEDELLTVQQKINDMEPIFTQHKEKKKEYNSYINFTQEEITIHIVLFRKKQLEDIYNTYTQKIKTYINNKTKNKNIDEFLEEYKIFEKIKYDDSNKKLLITFKTFFELIKLKKIYNHINNNIQKICDLSVQQEEVLTHLSDSEYNDSLKKFLSFHMKDNMNTESLELFNCFRGLINNTQNNNLFSEFKKILENNNNALFEQIIEKKNINSTPDDHKAEIKQFFLKNHNSKELKQSLSAIIINSLQLIIKENFSQQITVKEYYNNKPFAHFLLNSVREFLQKIKKKQTLPTDILNLYNELEKFHTSYDNHYFNKDHQNMIMHTINIDFNNKKNELINELATLLSNKNFFDINKTIFFKES